MCFSRNLWIHQWRDLLVQVCYRPLLRRPMVVAMNMTKLLTIPRLVRLFKLWQLILLAMDVPGAFPGVPINSSWHVQNAVNINPSSLTTPCRGCKCFFQLTLHEAEEESLKDMHSISGGGRGRIQVTVAPVPPWENSKQWYLERK